jgi:hypothetical protein
MNDTLLNRSIEQHPSVHRKSTVEPEGILIQVRSEMFLRNSSVVDSQKPAFQQGRDEMDARKHRLGGLFALPIQNDGLVLEPQAPQLVVSLPSISDDFGTGSNDSLDERFQALGGRIWNQSESYPAGTFAPDFDGSSDQGFEFSHRSSSITPQPTSDNDFIDFHFARQGLTARAYHRAAQLVEAGPSGLITPQAQDSLKAECADAALLAGNPPDRSKPEPQREMATMKDGSGGHGDILPARSAVEKPALGLPCLPMSALGTAKPFGPADASQVIAAGLFGAKPMLEFEQGLRI